MNASTLRVINDTVAIPPRVAELFNEQWQNIIRYTDRLFSWLMIFQWFFAVGLALWLSPKTWAGMNSQIHPHIWAAIFLGGIITSLPVYMACAHPGETLTRHTVAVGQMLMSVLLIHLTGGRIETHFHIFGSLAILAFYRDWKVLMSATAVVCVDHLVRGYFWPQSVFGVLHASILRSFEHAGWVLFEVVFLIISIRKSLSEMLLVAERQAKLEDLNETIERTVTERTAELTRENWERRQSQALYSSLVEQLPAGIFRKDAAGRYVFVNSRFCDFRGKSSNEILGKAADELAMSETNESDAQLLRLGAGHHQEIMRTGKAVEVMEEYRRANGKSHHLQVIKTPVFDADGNTIGSQGILVDITERKRAEAELAYERELLNALLNSSDDKIYFKDLESKFIRCSASMAKFFGVKKPEDLIGEADRDFFSDEHAQEAFEDEQKIIHTGEPLIGKMEKETWPDGRITWVLTTKMPLRNKAGEIAGTFGISKDFTAIKLAEAELNRERNLLRTIISSSPESIYVKDATGRKTMANLAELKNMGCKTEAEATGKSDFDIYPQDLAAQYFADDQAVIQSGQPLINREEKVVSPNGEVRWLLTSKNPLRDIDGKIIGLVGMGRDITAIKESEEKLNQVHKQLVDASHQAGMAEVATSVLHNVGNVLNSVNVSTLLIADKMRSSKTGNVVKVAALIRDHENDLGNFFTNDPKGKQLPEYLSKLAGHLAREQESVLGEIGSLVNNIVHIKEIVAMQQGYAKASGVLETLKVTDLLEDAMRMNDGAMNRHNVKVARNFAVVPPVLTDKHKVLQILINLIRNAKYACDDSGRQDKQITLKVWNGDGRIKISVVDNGIGIAPENLTRIFNHGFTTRKEGHGFGLHSGAIAAKELGGALMATSDGIGRGAAFTLELPVDQQQDTHEH